MKKKTKFFLKCLILLGWLPAWTGAIAAWGSVQDFEPAVSLGRKMIIESAILGEKREVWIVLPTGYENSSDRYSVLIQLGGRANFLHTAATVDVLSRNDIIPRLITVAVIDPSPNHHYRDSTPTRVDYLPTSGGAPLFLRFLKEELIPVLEKDYRVRPFRVLGGHGLSGFFAVYALLESPGTFFAAITDGASMTYDDSAFLKATAGKSFDPGLRGSLYLGVGSERETIPGLQALVGTLEKNAPSNLEWKLDTLEGEDQGTAALLALYRGLKWIFRDWILPVDVARGGKTAIAARNADLSRRYGYDIPVTESTLSIRGFQLIREQRFEEAKLLFSLNTEAYPESSNVYFNQAFLFERMKRWDWAAAAYDKAAEKAAVSQPDLAKYFRMQAETARRRIR